MTAYTVDFEPVGRRGRCQPGKSLLDCARQVGVDITSLCSGRGTCHACKVKVLAGTVSRATSSERAVFSPQELKAGWRLACQTYPASDVKLGVPAESMTTLQRTQVEGLEVAVPPEPAVSAYRVELPAPSLSDLQGDSERLLETLNQQHRLTCRTIDLDVLRQLSPRLRAWGWQCQAAVRDDEVVSLGPWPSRELGLAVDLGTTKVAGYLVDLSNGRTLASLGVMNPQISYGEDIISRITHASGSTSQARQLQKLAARAINRLAADLCAQVKAKADEITDAVVVGNTAMHHLLLGLPLDQLAQSPFVPAVSQAMDIKARDLGLKIAPGAYTHLLPNIAGFVGADHTSMLLATEAWRAEGVLLAIDIGTNTEVSLIDGGWITSVSCASGPAFEGGHIKDGMRAARGAIERLRLVSDDIQYQTIEGAPPVGLCGSGILDAMAQLYLAGIIEESGRMVEGHPRLRRGKQREFVLVSEEERGDKPAIVITQQDVRELQLAKAAIRTGIQVLLETNRRTDEEIGQVVIAGAFGSYIDVASAITIGMLPALPLDRFRQVGNAAGMGAKLALISRHKRAEAQALASRVNYIELASAPDFMHTFVQAGSLGKYRMVHGKRKEIS
ncbi:MAG TPA: DUF4445 domain-containing protein [Dehalococcoidia bacterium]|nr:DUF4445 domain-containing protein [Dehalococcoidia bacterium]